MNEDMMLSSVVFPAPVPPEMMTLSRALTMRHQVDHGLEALSYRMRSSALSASRRNFRMDRCGPSSQRLDDRVDAGAVGQPVDHGRGIVDPAADRGHDPVDHLEQVPVVLKADIGLLQAAVPLDEHLLRGVDQNVRDFHVLDQRLQRRARRSRPAPG
jgi:hypothetical protein